MKGTQFWTVPGTSIRFGWCSPFRTPPKHRRGLLMLMIDAGHPIHTTVAICVYGERAPSLRFGWTGQYRPLK